MYNMLLCIRMYLYRNLALAGFIQTSQGSAALVFHLPLGEPALATTVLLARYSDGPTLHPQMHVVWIFVTQAN